MPFFRIFIQADQIEIRSDYGTPLKGFFTHRLVRARSLDRAKDRAVRLAREEFDRDWAALNRTGSIRLTATDHTPITSRAYLTHHIARWVRLRPRYGATWYREG